MTIKHGATAPSDTRASAPNIDRTSATNEQVEARIAPSRVLHATSPKPSTSPVSKSARETHDYSLNQLIAHYQCLPETSSTHKFVAARLSNLMRDFSVEKRPELVILGRKGWGINACATPEGAIVVSPELLEFAQHVEELDFVLMHEAIHLNHGHHESSAKIDDSFVARAGRERINEYDADLAAFRALAHPARGSSPLGAISILERFNEAAPTAWDIEHGSLTDRIMNLKTMTLFCDFSTDGALPGDCGSLSKPLRSMPKFIAQEMSDLGLGSRVETLLQAPPLSREYDEYRAQLHEAISASELASLRWTFPRLLADLELQTKTTKALSSSATARMRLDSYFEVTQLCLSKIFEAVATTATDRGLPIETKRQLEGLELMLAGVTTEASKSCLPEAAQKRVNTTLSRFRQGLNSKESLETLTELASLVQGNIGLKNAQKLIFDVANAALVDNCVFDNDTDDSIDIRGFVATINSLIDKLAPLTLAPAYQERDVACLLESQAFLQLAAHLLDIKSPQLDEAVRHINDIQSPFLLKPGVVSSSLETALKLMPHSGVSSRLQDFTRDKLKLLSLDDTQAALQRIFENAAPLVQQISDPTRANDALDQLEKTFREAYHIAKHLPPHVQRSAVSSVRESEKKRTLPFSRRELAERLYEEGTKEDPSFLQAAPFEHTARLMTLKAGFLHALCDTAKERTLVSEKIDDGMPMTVPRFELVVALMNELRTERPEALIRGESLLSRTWDPNSKLGLHETAFNSLYDELFRGQSRLSSAQALERIYTFVSLTSVPEADNDSTQQAHRNILKFGERCLREVYKDDFSSEQFIKHALAVSFFDPNKISGRSIQRGLIARLIQTVGSRRAAEEVFLNLSSQRDWHNLETLEQLDETATNVDDIKTVAKLSKDNMLASNTIDQSAGRVVMSDLLVTLQRWDSFKVLFAGLSSAQDDSELTDMISQRWWNAQAEALYAPLRRESLPEPLEYATSDEDKATGDAFLSKLTKSVPTTLLTKNRSDLAHAEFDSPETLTVNSMRSGLYSLGMGERLTLLRKIANEPTRGVLISPERRVQVANGLLDMMLADTSSDRLTTLSSQAFRALFRAVPADDLGIALTPMLLDHFLRAPQASSSLRKFAEERAHDFLEDLGWERKSLARMSASPRKAAAQLFHSELHREVANHIEWALSGRNPRTKRSVHATSDNLMEMSGIKLSDHQALTRRGAIPFILDFSRNLQTPGTRALQLLGGIVELPPEIEREFLQVYDARKGQSKQSALNTIEKMVPDCAATLTSLKRIGGGALYSVFLADHKDGRKEVLRVANPNPEYHTRRILHSMRAAQAQLERENEEFAIGKHVINLVDEWISAELRDATFEADDKQFRKSWNNWRPISLNPFSKKCPLSIHIPQSQPTGTLLVRREEFIPGRNFTELEAIAKEDPKLAKAAVALAVQHYSAQIKGAMFSTADAVVHSDISPGNLRLMDGGKVAILDRSMFLKFSVSDRLALKKLSLANTSAEQASIMVEALAEMRETKITSAEKGRITAAVQEALQGAGSVESTLLKGFLTAQREGLMVPLRFQLLVKNLNSFRVMAQKVGFASLKEASEYQWK